MTSHRPRKRFGQHFLTDPSVVEAILAAIAPASDDTVVEIGPGTGAITHALARRAGRLHAVEVDRDLAATLESRFAADGNVEIHQADALKFDFASLGNNLRVVGNLPYNISTPLLFHLLEQRESIRDLHVMLQKEVVDRMAAAPGGRDFGRLTVMLGCHFAITRLFDVERDAFDPPPQVVSAVARLTPLPPGTFTIQSEKVLSRVVATAFSQRRKTLRNSLKTEMDAAELEALGIDANLRPEAVDIGHWVAMANHVAVRTDTGA